MTAHSELGPSAAHRWMKCPGSVALSRTVPASGDTEASREGTIAHKLASHCLENGLYDAADGIDSVAGATPEMAKHVTTYLTAVYTALESEKGGDGAALYVERRFSLEHIIPGVFGTCDAVVIVPAKRLVHVFDYKHGAGTYVSVAGNPQLQMYALGALELFKGFKISTVRITVVQPRNGDEAVRSADMDRVELLDFRADIVAAAAETRKTDAPVVPGKWCQFCPAKIVCPALKAAAVEAAQRDFKQDTASTRSGFTLGQMLRTAKLAARWCEAVEEFAKREASAGRMPEGYKYVGGIGNREWGTFAPAALQQAAGNACSVSETSLRSPAQVERDMGKKEFEARMARFVVRKPRAPMLAPADDPRPAWTSEAVKGF